MPRVSFLFWNINRKPLTRLICELAAEHKVDVLILAECEIDRNDLVHALSSVALYRFPASASERIQVFTRLTAGAVSPVEETPYCSIRRLVVPEISEILMVAVHLHSKLYQSAESQGFETTRLASLITEAERAAGHSRTLLVGDLNMDPFESGMVAAAGLNAVMTRGLANRGTRMVRGGDYRYFYNPMWSRFGDLSEGPPGTYFYNRTEQVTHYWHMFDQVLLRPALMPHLAPGDPQVLTSTGVTSLVAGDGLPDRRNGSDHLPLLFRLEL